MLIFQSQLFFLLSKISLMNRIIMVASPTNPNGMAIIADPNHVARPATPINEKATNPAMRIRVCLCLKEYVISVFLIFCSSSAIRIIRSAAPGKVLLYSWKSSGDGMGPLKEEYKSIVSMTCNLFSSGRFSIRD